LLPVIALLLLTAALVLLGRWRPGWSQDRGLGPVGLGIACVLLASVILWRLSRIDVSAIGVLNLIQLVLLLITLGWFVWARYRS
jgi:hypothetical protein